MFSKDMIDFDSLHGEIRFVLARQKELRAIGIVPYWWGFLGHKDVYDSKVKHFKDALEKSDDQHTKWSIIDKERAQKPLFFEGMELSYLSCRITVLCSILAQAKGRIRHQALHKKFSNYNLQWTDGIHLGDGLDAKKKAQEKLIGDEWKQFLKEETVAPEDITKPKLEKAIELGTNEAGL